MGASLHHAFFLWVPNSITENVRGVDHNSEIF